MFKGDGIDLPVLEIGPGTGVLTQYLMENFKEIRAIELDRESVVFLKENFVPKGLKLMEGDFLDSRNDDMFFPDDVLILGNFPYNISSQIVFKVLDNISKVKGFGGMFQKEVAERLVAGPGSKTYGILSVFLNTYYKTSYEFTVGPELFTPPPKVQTGVIKATRIDGYERFIECIRITLVAIGYKANYLDESDMISECGGRRDRACYLKVTWN